MNCEFISPIEFKSLSGKPEITKDKYLSFVINKQGQGLILEGKNGIIGGANWIKKKYFNFDILYKEYRAMCLTIRAWKKDNFREDADVMIIIGVLPKIATRISIPLEVFNGQKLFSERTPGRLKTVYVGNKIDIRDIRQIEIGSLKSSINQTVEIYNINLSEKEPDYPLPQIKLVDDMGQWALKDWEGRMQSPYELEVYLNSEHDKSIEVSFFDDWNQYGGWKKKKFKSTGYFRTEYDGNRWWLVDPEGCAFFSTGLDCVRPDEPCGITGIEKFLTWLPEDKNKFSEAYSERKGLWEGRYYDFSISNLIRVFGSRWREAWERITRRRLVEWGFNTIANWSSIELAQKSKLPYVIPLDKEFPKTKETIFRDFPDVFSQEYKENSERFAESLRQYAEDKYLIGYFLRNEPQWAFVNGINIAEELLESEKNFHSKKALIEFLKERYWGSIIEFNRAWNLKLDSFDELGNKIVKATKLSEKSKEDLEDFSKIMIRLYVQIPSECAKKIDKNHLNLGIRYAWVWSDIILSGWENFDVFSFNCYKVSPEEQIKTIGQKLNKPIIIGEFHFGALDRGPVATGLRAVTSQEERGKAYKYYVESGAAEKYCVGVHYFTLNDQPTLGRFDGENYQIGLVDVCHREYTEFTEAVANTHKGMYYVADGIREKTNVKAQEIELVAF